MKEKEGNRRSRRASPADGSRADAVCREAEQCGKIKESGSGETGAERSRKPANKKSSVF